jgi:hypothetical protein
MSAFGEAIFWVGVAFGAVVGWFVLGVVVAVYLR